MFLQRNMVFLSQLIAVYADFDTAHRCTNLADEKNVVVAHVGEGNVLVFKGRASSTLNMNDDFVLRECKVATKI